jgi:beta-lactamase superfamily II metal-dependent hydrolase
VIDVEGGGATLFVSPSGESLLIDTGNGGDAAARDAGRIMAAIRDAGVERLDHLIITHYHGDHVGGFAELAKQVPIAHYIDHGENIQPEGSGARYFPHYEELASAAGRTIARPGDTIDMTGLDIWVAASAGEIIDSPLPGAGAPNPYCEGYSPIAPDTSENGQSVGIRMDYGEFTVAHLGDLTWNGELELACPTNKFGMADVFIVNHHAQRRPAAMSNAEPLVYGLQSRVAISSNGIRKGAQVEAMKVLFSAPGLEDIWQLHFSQFSGQEYTVPGAFIANRFEGETAVPIAPTEAQSPDPSAPPIPPHEGPAHYLTIDAWRDGTFTVTNTRNGFVKTYHARVAD